jgi:hypothetical protein
VQERNRSGHEVARYELRYARRGYVLPVAAPRRPVDGLEAEVPARRVGPLVEAAVGRPVEPRPRADRGLERAEAARDLVTRCRPTQLVVARVSEAVQRELVAAGGGVARDRVAAQQLLAYDEERGLQAEPVERVEERGRRLLVGTVVEGQDGLAVVLEPLERGQLAPALERLDVLPEARN